MRIETVQVRLTHIRFSRDNITPNEEEASSYDSDTDDDDDDVGTPPPKQIEPSVFAKAPVSDGDDDFDEDDDDDESSLKFATDAAFPMDDLKTRQQNQIERRGKGFAQAPAVEDNFMDDDDADAEEQAAGEPRIRDMNYFKIQREIQEAERHEGRMENEGLPILRPDFDMSEDENVERATPDMLVDFELSDVDDELLGATSVPAQPRSRTYFEPAPPVAKPRNAAKNRANISRVRQKTRDNFERNKTQSDLKRQAAAVVRAANAGRTKSQMCELM